MVISLASLVLAAPSSRRKKQDVSSDLSNSKAITRQQAAEKIVSGQATGQTQDIARALKAEPNVQVRARLLQALGESDAMVALPVLTDALAKDPAPLVREIAARTIARLGGGGKEGMRALIAGLAKDADANVRAACAVGLSFHSASEAVEALEKAAEDSDPQIRLHTALALTRQPKSRKVDRALDRLERDRDPNVANKSRNWRKK